MFEVKNLSKKWGSQTVFDAVDFKVEVGEIVGITGPSGSGKSTLLRCLCSLDQPNGGEISMGADSMGFVFQGFHLFPHMSVLENLTYAPVCRKTLSLSEACERAEKLLAQVGLSHRKYSYPKTLSGGEKQRVAILRALMLEPRALLLDEPTSALDPVRTQELAEILKDLSKTGISMVIVSHEMDWIKSLATRVLHLENGALQKVEQT